MMEVSILRRLNGHPNIIQLYEVIETTNQIALVLGEVFKRLAAHGVDLKTCLLKPQMVMPGSESSEKASAQEVARATLDVFDECLTDDLAGVFFLSGGLIEEQATVNLNELNLAAKE